MVVGFVLLGPYFFFFFFLFLLVVLVVVVVVVVVVVADVAEAAPVLNEALVRGSSKVAFG